MDNVQNSDNFINIPPHTPIAINIVTVVEYSCLCLSSLPLNEGNRGQISSSPMWTTASSAAALRYFVSSDAGDAVTEEERKLVTYCGRLCTPPSQLCIY
jgi:hypothetical protein